MMMTYDEQDGLARAAVWKGKVLEALYLDCLARPDLSGAIVRAKAARVLAAQKAAWFEAGLPEKLFVQGADVKAGQIRNLRIKSTMRYGKAWPAQLLPDEGEEGDLGILTPPPSVIQRAQADFGGKLTLEKLKKPMPELDDLMDALSTPRVALPGGAELVIEPTEALIAIDINAGESANPAAVNLLAVREAARQIRLRNLSGLIVIDALKMKNRADISKVLNALKHAAEADPAGVHVFGMTKLGLIEITRTRRGPSLSELMERLK